MTPLLALASLLAATPPTPAPFHPEQAPLRPEEEPHAGHFVNRDRVYDFYAKQALAFGGKEPLPALLPAFPGLDQAKYGQQGNQNDRETWKDGRWGASDFGNLFSGVFRGAGLTLPKAVWVSDGRRHAVFDPLTLAFRARWTGGFVKLGDLRHGFMTGAVPGGPAEAAKPVPAVRGAEDLYRGFFRHGAKVIFSYRRGGVDYLASAEDGERPAAELAHLTRGGPARWPGWIQAGGRMGSGRPIATDTLIIPHANPYGTLFFLTGLDFLSDDTLAVATMTGEVWLVRGADGDLSKARWKRFATGLHQPLGIVSEGSRLLVLGRDQVTRLHDLNGDDEADYHECLTDGMRTSPGSHDYVIGLERDAQGRLLASSGNEGLIRLVPGKAGAEVVGTGLRNPNGIGLSPDGRFLTSSLQEGTWTPASSIVQVDLEAAGDRPHFGHGGPRDGKPIALPLLQLPRGEDNSSAGQVFLGEGRWPGLAGPSGNLVHFSYGTGSAWLVTRQQVDGVWQGAATRLGGGMDSGAQQGRFHPRDGHLYVTGLTGWQTYTPDDGCLHRLRHTGGSPLPVAHAAHANGVRLDFDRPLEAAAAGRAAAHFAQCWNYREPTGAYGSPEFSVRHPGARGHDPLSIRGAHLLAGGKSLFLEIPDITPANQVHLRVAVASNRAIDVFLTAHRLAPDFTGFPGYAAKAKPAAEHAGHAAAAGNTVALRPIPWEGEFCDQPTRPVLLRAGTALQFETKELRARRGEWLALTFENPDGMSHNWLLAKPGSADRIADLAGKMAGMPDAHARHYAPESDEVLVHTRVVDPGKSTLIRFQAPTQPGRYPYLCTLPGHALLMRGELVVE